MSDRVALVVGSRAWPEGDLWFVTQKMIEHLGRDWTIRSGGARGVDQHAIREAIRLRWSHDEMKADWRPGGVYNPRAGFERNSAMLDKSPRPLVVLAFQHEGSRGTQHTIDQARKRGVPVRVFTAEDMRPDIAALDYDDEPIFRGSTR